MKKRDAKNYLKQVEKMKQQLEAIQDAVVEDTGDNESAVWDAATAARWAASSLVGVLERIAR